MKFRDRWLAIQPDGTTGAGAFLRRIADDLDREAAAAQQAGEIAVVASIADMIGPADVPMFRSCRTPSTAILPLPRLAATEGGAGHQDARLAALLQRVEAAADGLFAAALRVDTILDRTQPIDDQVAWVGQHHRRIDAARLDLRDRLLDLDLFLRRRQSVDAVGERAATGSA